MSDYCDQCGWGDGDHAWLCPTRPPFVKAADGAFVSDPTRDRYGRHVHGAWCHPSAEGCPEDFR